MRNEVDWQKLVTRIRNGDKDRDKEDKDTKEMFIELISTQREIARNLLDIAKRIG